MFILLVINSFSWKVGLSYLMFESPKITTPAYYLSNDFNFDIFNSEIELIYFMQPKTDDFAEYLFSPLGYFNIKIDNSVNIGNFNLKYIYKKSFGLEFSQYPYWNNLQIHEFRIEYEF